MKTLTATAGADPVQVYESSDPYPGPAAVEVPAQALLNRIAALEAEAASLAPLVGQVTTTNATRTTILEIPIPANTVTAIYLRALAVSNGGDFMMWEKNATGWHIGAQPVSSTGWSDTFTPRSSDGSLEWNLDLGISEAHPDILYVTVGGAAETGIAWTVNVETISQEVPTVVVG